MQLTIKADIRAAEKALGTLKKQVPFAAWMAKKNTVFKMRRAVQNHMGRVFKTTSRYTMQAPVADYPSYSTYKNSAEKTAALNLIGQYTGRKGNRLRERHYLWDHIHGQRTSTGFERRLQTIGALKQGEFAVKTKYLNLFSGGKKTSKGIYMKILSQLKAMPQGQGYASNATGSRRSRAKRQKQIFFVQRKGGTPGIWMRYRTAGGRLAVPVFIFVDSAKYKKRFRFYEVSAGAAKRHWPIEFLKAISRALETAK